MSEDVTIEQYTELKNKYDELSSKFDTLLEKSNQFVDEMNKKDEKIRVLNDRLYDLTFTTKKPADPEDDKPKDFKTLYIETLNEMSKDKR